MKMLKNAIRLYNGTPYTQTHVNGKMPNTHTHTTHSSLANKTPSLFFVIQNHLAEKKIVV